MAERPSCWCPCGALISLAPDHQVTLVHLNDARGFEDVGFCSAACMADWIEAHDADGAAAKLAGTPRESLQTSWLIGGRAPR